MKKALEILGFGVSLSFLAFCSGFCFGGAWGIKYGCKKKDEQDAELVKEAY